MALADGESPTIKSPGRVQILNHWLTLGGRPPPRHDVPDLDGLAHRAFGATIRATMSTQDQVSPPTSRLRPAAVVCADVERYASLADQHEWLLKFDHLMGKLGQEIRDDLCASLGEEAAKRCVVKQVGDGVLLVYPGEIKKALEHAWRIHDHFNTRSGRERQREYGLWPFQARIAVHYGDVELIERSPFNDAPDAFGKTIVTCSRLEPAIVPGMVWATQEAVDAAMGQGMGATYRFQQIGMVDLAKNAGRVLAHNMVKTEGAGAQWGALSVKRYPKGIQADVFVLVHRPSERLPTVHLAWGASHCVVHRSELDPTRRAYRIKHKLLGSHTDLPLLVVHTDPPCQVEFPELRFWGDGAGSLHHPQLTPQDGIQDIDTEVDHWYLLPGRV
jgi:class 3 adenylate cyclase